MKIVLDTNFLIYAIKYNIFQQIEQPGLRLIVPKQVISELIALSKNANKKKDRESAKIAVQLIKKVKINIVESTAKNTDNAILDIAAKEKAEIATMDKHLIGRARKIGIKTVQIRNKAYIQLN